MNWGYRILIVYLVFVAGILFLVIRTSNEKTDLVTKDYYAKELRYQQQIDETGRTAALSAPVMYEVKGHELFIRFPKDFAGKKLSGDVLLYCPSDENKDIRQDFSVQDTTVIVSLPVSGKGLYELHISWESEGTKYYFEKRINI
jgi:hypothetical protein